jgi:2-pyrone-4,6-dicarboxylate lactonase
LSRRPVIRRRLHWASDWSFVDMKEAAPDVGHLIDLFDEWVNDGEIEKKIFVENPRALYGFE